MTKLFVGNLAFDVTDGDLLATFAAYGSGSTARVVTEKSSGDSRGFGFVELVSPSQANAAIAALDGTLLKGRNINVSRARPRGDGGSRGERPRGWAVVGDARHRW